LKEPTGDLPETKPQEKETLAKILNQAGLSYLRRQQDAPALKWMRAAAEVAPDEVQVLTNIAFMLQRMGQLDEASALLEKEHARFPKAFDLQLQRAQILLARGDAAAGQTHFLELMGRGLQDV